MMTMDVEISEGLQFTDNKYSVQEILMKAECVVACAKRARRLHRSALPYFPTEMYVKIFEFFTPAEVHATMALAICHDWREIERDAQLWKFLCMQSWGLPDSYCEMPGWRNMHKLLVRDQAILGLYGYQDVVRICANHLQSVKVQVMACARLRSLAVTRQPTMTSFLNSAKQFFCEVVPSFFGVPPPESVDQLEEYRLQMAQNGGICAVLNAMRAHPGDSEVQAEACKVLVVFSRPLGGAEGRAFVGREDILTNVTRVGNEGGVGLVMEAMRRHPHDASLQANACWALVNLALVSDHKQMIVKEGGVDLILSAMTNHSQDAEVQYRACFVLVNLAIPESNKSMIVEKGGVPLILSAMKLHPSHLQLQHRACVVLRNLCFLQQNIGVLKRAGVRQLIEVALANHPQDQQIQLVACDILESLQ
eukprot:GILK01001601.1.p1 GENE.GILK01001601.1~~GILK01001601.1.p1  ORF type:complete len:421 (+),score=59.88 GILK01001601.1:219-1481(+)